MDHLTPEQKFEESQRRTPPAKFEDDKDVKDTLKSIESAEEQTGGKLPDPESEEEKKKIKPTPPYHLADSDEEEDDAGDSTVETRRSIQYAENSLKKRWFINAQERRTFNKKVAAGAIRPEVLDFNDKSDSDPSATLGEIADKEVAKKKTKVAADDAKEEEKKEAAENKTPEEKEATKLEKEDKAAKEEAVKATEVAEKPEKEVVEAKKALTEAEKTDKEAAEEDFVPPEMSGAV